MVRNYSDFYRGRNSLIHRLDPRIKIIAAFGFILSVVFTRPSSFLLFAAYALVVSVALVLSKIPVGWALKRSLVIIPFVLVIAVFIPFFKRGQVIGGYSFGILRLTLTFDGLMVLWNVFAKSYLSVFAMIVLIGSTPYLQLLRGFEKLKCPAIIVMILSFMYRYGFVLADELAKMRQAKAARTVGGARWFHTRILANILGTLFVRSYERGEAVYLAMCARGFEGEIRTLNELRLAKRDFFFLGATVLILAGLRLLGMRL